MEVRKIVKYTLDANEKARSDDIEWFVYANKKLWRLSEEEAYYLQQLLNKCINYETYRRARQKVQAEHEELKPDEGTKNMRRDREEYMRANRGDVDATNRDMQRSDYRGF